ncbi:MAG: phosphate/phosphite/phosphonate ABC transporter substrate-binding protein, partial [Sphingobium limneticum]
MAAFAFFALAGCGGESTPDNAGDGWRGDVKELRMAISSLGQGTGDQTARLELLREYMAKATGLPVRLYHVNDPNSTVQALTSGQVDVATMGAGAYANVHDQIGDKATPLLVTLGAGGETGYYSALVVRADRPFRTLADLKGRSLAVVDLNSTSGYLLPMHALRRKGVDPTRYFSRVGVTGGHENAVMAVRSGQYDAAFVMAAGGTPETGFSITAYSMMEDRGLIPRGSIRDIMHVGPMPNIPFVMRTDGPQAMQDLVRGALAALPYDAGEDWGRLGIPAGTTLTATDDAAFAEVFALRT